ncbi:hypothetical protein LXL04_020081 [Taraxacum kok-saghyz]
MVLIRSSVFRALMLIQSSGADKVFSLQGADADSVFRMSGMIFRKSQFPALSSFSNPNPSTVASNHCPHLPRPVAPVPTSAPPFAIIQPLTERVARSMVARMLGERWKRDRHRLNGDNWFSTKVGRRWISRAASFLYNFSAIGLTVCLVISVATSAEGRGILPISVSRNLLNLLSLYAQNFGSFFLRDTEEDDCNGDENEVDIMRSLVNVPVVQPLEGNEVVVKPVLKTVVKSVTKGDVKRKITYIANGTLAKRTRNSTLNKLNE